MVVAGYVFLALAMFSLLALGLDSDRFSKKKKTIILALFFVFFVIAVSLIVANELI